MSLYTPDVQKVFKTMKPPLPGFIVDVIEYPQYLALRVYKDNVESYSEPQKVALSHYIYELEQAIRSCGVSVILDGVNGGPPNRR